jgi:hypothetical protein
MPTGSRPQSLPFSTLDVFTTTPYRGNPLGVVSLPPATASSSTPLTQEQKQTIARELNLSETVFVHAENGEEVEEEGAGGEKVTRMGGREGRRVDIFTTEEELPFAGMWSFFFFPSSSSELNFYFWCKRTCFPTFQAVVLNYTRACMARRTESFGCNAGPGVEEKKSRIIALIFRTALQPQVTRK